MKWFVTFPLFATLVSQVAFDVVQGGLAGAAHLLFALTPGVFVASVAYGLYRRDWL
ncbi:MAG: hypothetical protein KIT09_08980 [Bryobacteraceae bacterium]|nr:hypothetical protein [Bryobacteraceae bacterium]